MPEYTGFAEVSFEIKVSTETRQDADLVIRRIIYETFKREFGRAENLKIKSLMIINEK